MAVLRHTHGQQKSLQNQGVEARLEALEGAEAARIILAKYAAAVDAQDLKAVSALLDQEVTLSAGEMSVEGYENVVQFFQSAFDNDPSLKSHFVTNIEPSWIGQGQLNVDACFLWTGGTDSQSIIGWGTYSNRVSVKNGDAKFTAITLTISHMGEIGEGWTIGSESA